MVNDPTEAITESAKALREITNTGGKLIDASGRVGSWLTRNFGQGIEDTVALHWSDRIRARRIERSIYDWARLTEAMELFLRRMIVDQKLPFEVVALDRMTLARIEEEAQAAQERQKTKRNARTRMSQRRSSL
jgi:hypothetical protein